MTVRIVVGPPASGKSTYIADNAAPGDFRVDLDVLRRALGAEKAHEAPYELSMFARRVRDLAIDAALKGDIKGDSWIIHTNPNAEQIAAYRAAGAELVLVDPGMDTVLEQATADGRPEWTEQAVRDWYAEPPNIEPTSEPPKGGFSHARKGTKQMRTKNVQVAFKAGPDDGLAEGEFKVYPATFTREPDAYGDVVAKGAFEESLKAWSESGDVMPAMYLHDPNQIVGGASDMGEDEHGWWVKGFFDDDPAAQRIYNLVKGRRLTNLSFAFDVLDEAQIKLDDGTKVNELRKLSVHEFSFLPKGFAANPDTSVVAVKAAAEATLEGLKAGRVLAQKHIDSLRSAQEAIGAVIDAATVEDQEKASGQGEVKSEEPETVKDEGQSVNPSVEALAAKAQLLALKGASK